MVSAALEANKISAAFPYQKKRQRVLGSEMAYVDVGKGDPIVLASAWRAQWVERMDS